MPLPRNWLEELVAEWLSLQGYLVETNIRLLGKREADVIGVKLEGWETDDKACGVLGSGSPRSPLERRWRRSSENSGTNASRP